MALITKLSIKRGKVHNLVIKPTPQAGSHRGHPRPIKTQVGHGPRLPSLYCFPHPCRDASFLSLPYCKASFSAMILKLALSGRDRSVCVHTCWVGTRSMGK